MNLIQMLELRNVNNVYQVNLLGLNSNTPPHKQPAGLHVG